MLILERPWTRQPQQRCSLDWCNPINRGLVEAYNWIDKVDLVAQRGAITDYAVAAIGPAGRAVTFSAELHVITGKQWNGATNWTFLTVALPDTSKTAAISFSQATSGGQSYLLFNTNSGYGSSAGYFGFGSGATSGGSAITAVAGGIVAYPATYIGTQSDQRRIYRDGVLLGTGASGGITVSGSPHKTCLNGIDGYGGWASSGSKYFLTMIWDRALSPAEIARIGANPWQLFQPRRIYIPTATAAASAPTITALSAIGITATSAQPRISYS